MGIYDRSYYSEEQTAWRGGPLWDQRMVITNLIIINVAVFVLDKLLSGSSFGLNESIRLESSDLYRPWEWWKVLSYSFAHSGIWHLFWNMFGLWMLGRSVEEIYGKSEFLRIYLAAAIVGGAVFLARTGLTGAEAAVVGASGAVIAIELLFVLHNPNGTILLYGVIPVPTWLLGALLVVGGLWGGDSNTAFDVHAAGIGFGFIYFAMKWNLGSALEKIAPRKLWKRATAPRLRVLSPDDSSGVSKDEAEADRLLQKIHEHGQDSLTAKEKKFLQKYSLKTRKKREQNGGL